VRGSICLTAPCRCVPVNSDVMPQSAEFLVLPPQCELRGRAFCEGWSRESEERARYGRSEPPSVAARAGSLAAANGAPRGEAQNRCPFLEHCDAECRRRHRADPEVRAEAYAAVLRRVAAVSRRYALCIDPGITWQSTRTSYRPAFAGLLSAGHFYVSPHETVHVSRTRAGTRRAPRIP
jgi:hypothetical protein